MAAKREEQLSYEAAREELLEVVRQLESGGLPLEKSLALWERGEELAQICQNWLDGARARLAAGRPAQRSSTSSDGASPNDASSNETGADGETADDD